MCVYVYMCAQKSYNETLLCMLTKKLLERAGKVSEVKLSLLQRTGIQLGPQPLHLATHTAL